MSSIQTIYIVPAGPTELRGKIFEPNLPIAPIAPLGGDFLYFFREKGIQVKTIDAWNPAIHNADDVVVFINHPDDDILHRFFYFFKYILRGRKRFAISPKELSLIRRLFSKKILFQGEPPTNMPYPYVHLKRLAKLYDVIFLYHKMMGVPSNVFYTMWPRDFREEFESFFAVPKDKFLVMMNNNARPHAFFAKELYSERLRAIKFFSSSPGFDLYGGRWERKPFFPFWSYRAYVQKCWRGYVNGDKIKTFASYRFSLAFENSQYPGYVSEKIFDSFLAGCIPVYLGAPDVTDYVPADCFIDMRAFKDYGALLIHLQSLSDVECALYRDRIKHYLISQKNNIFSKRKFAETLWGAMINLP